MVHDEANVARRGAELLVYFQLLFTRRDLLALPQFAENMGFGLDTLTERCCRVPDLCAKDPQLLRRAMAYLRATGEVLYHDLATAAAVRERVFLEPQRLIDLMKEFVHHDLATQLAQIQPDSPFVTDAGQIRELGRDFLRRGVLDRRLVPWLWRDLHPPVSADPEQIDFLMQLLAQLGLLTLLPGSADAQPQWLLPMRLPERSVVLATASARGKLATFLAQMAAESPGSFSLSEALDGIAQAGLIVAGDLQRGAAVAFAKADSILMGAARDEHGLDRDQIAAINLYTQEDLGSGLSVYRPLNTALRSEDLAQIRPFWRYTQLLQQAVLSLPPADDDVYRGLSDPQPDIALQDIHADIAGARPLVWWAFSSTSTSEAVSRSFLRGRKNVLYAVSGAGRQARNVKRYSHIPTEDELLMPCGTAFASQAVEVSWTCYHY